MIPPPWDDSADFAPDGDAPDNPPPRQLPRFRVVLHRATEHALLAVVRAVRDLTRFAEEEAMARMWEAHHRGRATVIETHLERAELYAEQFADRGLSVSLEPA